MLGKYMCTHPKYYLSCLMKCLAYEFSYTGKVNTVHTHGETICMNPIARSNAAFVFLSYVLIDTNQSMYGFIIAYFNKYKL